MNDTWTQDNILARVKTERRRQERLREDVKFAWSCATTDPAVSNSDKLAVLAEEFGEVARHVAEELIDSRRLERAKLQKELIEVAAVAVAWAESLEP